MKTNSKLPLWLLSFAVIGCGAWIYFLAPDVGWVARARSEARYQLGNCYVYGIGLSRNPAKAVGWYRAAADRGHARAQNALGMLYLRGAGVSMSHESAVKWYRRAAEQGLAEAQNQLGMMYAQGKGVRQDFEEASRWFTKAAGQGCAASRTNLALVAAAQSTHLGKLTLRDGSSYEGVEVQKIELDSLTINYHPKHGGVGVAKVALKDLPQSLREKYSFSAAPGTQVASSAQLGVVVPHAL